MSKNRVLSEPLESAAYPSGRTKTTVLWSREKPELADPTREIAEETGWANLLMKIKS